VPHNLRATIAAGLLHSPYLSESSMQVAVS